MRTTTISYAKRNCAFEGCENSTRSKGSRMGRTRYDKWCVFHYHLRYRDRIVTYMKRYMKRYNKQRTRIDNSNCEKCGWDKAPCDRHRIDPRKGYTEDNILVLCPNCHRLATLQES